MKVIFARSLELALEPLELAKVINSVPVIRISTVVAVELASCPAVTVGTVLSKVRPDPVVVAETLVPTLDARSLNLIVKANAPLVSAEFATKEAVQAVAELLAMASDVLATAAPPEVLVALTDEDRRGSLEEKVMVTVSPVLT